MVPKLLGGHEYHEIMINVLEVFPEKINLYVVGKIMPPKDVHPCLHSLPPPHATWHDKRNSADVIKLGILKWEDCTHYLSQFNLISWILKIRQSFPALVRGRCMNECSGRYKVASFKKGESMNQGMRAVSRNKKGKEMDQFSPRASRKTGRSLLTLIF